MTNSRILLSLIVVGCLYTCAIWWMHLFLPSENIETGNNDYDYPKDSSSADRDTIEAPIRKENRILNGTKFIPRTIIPSLTTSNELPKALQVDPVWIDSMGNLSSVGERTGNDMLHRNCCAHWGQRRKNKRGANNSRICTGICYTPEACDDMIFPFQNEEEKRVYWGDLNAREGFNSWKNTTKDECLKPKRLVPPVHWNTTSPFPFSDSLPPPGCSHYTGGGGSGAFQNLFIIPSAKLAFCGIPKNGHTNWLQFIRFVMGAHDFASFPHGKPDLRYWSFDILNPVMQKKIWNDPEWTFAAILRNPADRLLSAYLDKLKVGPGSGSIAKHYNFNKSFTFDVFLQYLEKETPKDLNCQDKDLTGLNWCTDPHWRPQVYSCGMSEKIDRFDFIGNLDHIDQHSRALLEKVGLWESHGQHYRYGISNRTAKANPCGKLFPLSDEFQRIPLALRQNGFQQRSSELNNTGIDIDIDTNKSNKTKGGKEKLSWDVIGHSRRASGKKQQYYTPEMLQKVRDKLYKEDFQVWSLLQKKGDWVSGKELLASLINTQESTNTDIVASLSR